MNCAIKTINGKQQYNMKCMNNNNLANNYVANIPKYLNVLKTRIFAMACSYIHAYILKYYNYIRSQITFNIIIYRLLHSEILNIHLICEIYA